MHIGFKLEGKGNKDDRHVGWVRTEGVAEKGGNGVRDPVRGGGVKRVGLNMWQLIVLISPIRDN